MRLISAIVLSFLMTSYCFAVEGVTKISRYMTVSNKPQLEQIELMNQEVQIHYPPQVRTIGEALRYLLRFSGYSLISESKMENALKILINKPLPLIDRQLGPVTLKDALKILAGKFFILEEDPVNREIYFKLRSEGKRYLKKGQIL